MLNKDLERFLTLAISKPKNENSEAYISAEELGLTQYDVDTICQSLHKEGYLLKYRHIGRVPKKVAVVLSYKGLRFYEFKWLKFKEFLLKSVAVPITVSVITAIITGILLS